MAINTGIDFVTTAPPSPAPIPTPRSTSNRDLFWFNPSHFRAAAPLSFGNAGRNVIAAPASSTTT